MDELMDRIPEDQDEERPIRVMRLAPDNMTMTDHKYGYRVNINHPKINPYYRRYKEWREIAFTAALSDQERAEFEAYMLPIIEKWRRRK